MWNHIDYDYEEANKQLAEQYPIRELLVNKIQCPDGTILASRYMHDYVDHTQEDGRYYAIDGGLGCTWVNFSDEDYVNLCVYSDDPHEKIREHFTWCKRCDKDGNYLPQPEMVLLKDLEDSHLEELCDFTSNGYPVRIHKVMLDEREYRRLYA